MNKLKSLLVAAFLLVSVASFAQTGTVKVGYTNANYIISQLPESRQIESDLKAHSSQLEKELQNKYKSYQEKVEAYKKGAGQMTDVVRADREKELTTLQASIEEFQRNADASLQKKEQEKLQPVMEKIQKAIDKVAKENGYTHIFTAEALLYGPEDGNAFTDLVLKDLGVTPAPKGSPAASAASPAATAPKPAVTAPSAVKKKK
ncbi:OmpH family outer membrane protein [Rufibacter immobilis]|uniref:OmpH family outer membrane protein n=1 Tax=Rufibacter immobilis TaxID=1348778 RepID=A0A3M9MXE4_9BACT|nr:OmpH family outer membrane protein [Rufibacter immobilis]RNI30221.1 OmpH family outer membrane protein [Rufibacter immobilis]